MSKVGLTVGLVGVFPLVAGLQPQEPAVFHSGTRLVEVEVTVRNPPVRPPGVGEWFKWVLDSGPPFGPPGALHQGLTRDDFTLFDQGKPQQIAVFREGATSSTDVKSLNLPPGAVSNRQDNRGQPVKGTTAILIDFLNTDFGCLGYERLGMTKFLHSFAETDSRVALYTLGESLHVLQDFTDDPKKLMATADQLGKSHVKTPKDIDEAIRDFGDLLDLGRDEVHGQMTVKALRLIMQRLSGVPGRKNLVWLMHDPHHVPPPVLAIAQQANVVVYPVLVRLVGGELCVGGDMHAAEGIAAATGGRAFFDVLDLPAAVRTTEEDTGTSYVLGYYPEEDMLDGKYHNITVKLRNKALVKQDLEVHYRPGYLATKVALPTPSPSLAELFNDPVVSSRIGLVAQATAAPEHPGAYDVRVAVDLHDIHIEPKDGHFMGAFDLSVSNPSSKGTVYTSTIPVDLTDKRLAETLEDGYPVYVQGALPESGEIRIAVRDRATGTTGSLRIPVAK